MNSAPKNNTQGHFALGHVIEDFGSEWVAYSNSGHSQEVHFLPILYLYATLSLQLPVNDLGVSQLLQ